MSTDQDTPTPSASGVAAPPQGAPAPGAEHWSQYSWRPWNGFWFAPSVVLIYFVLPLVGKVVPSVPMIVWAGWLGILGVSAWGRNREKVIKAGGSAEGTIAAVVKAIKG